jgi:hypothetical protein
VFCDAERRCNAGFCSTLIGTVWPTHREIERLLSMTIARLWTSRTFTPHS